MYLIFWFSRSRCLELTPVEAFELDLAGGRIAVVGPGYPTKIQKHSGCQENDRKQPTGDGFHQALFLTKRRRADCSARRQRIGTFADCSHAAGKISGPPLPPGEGRVRIPPEKPETRMRKLFVQDFLYLTPQPWGRVSSSAGVSPFNKASTASFR